MAREDGKAACMKVGCWAAAISFSCSPFGADQPFPTRQRGCWRKRPTPHSCALKVGAGTPETGAVLPLGLYLRTEQGDPKKQCGV